MARVPYDERMKIVKLSFRGYSQRRIAAEVRRPLKTVNRIIQAYRDEGRIKDAPHRRRPQATSASEDLLIVAVANNEPSMSAKRVRGTIGLNVNDSTVRSRLHDAGLRSRVAAKKPLLSGQNKIARLRFAMTTEAGMLTTSTFSTRWDQQQRVWRLEGTRFTQENLKHVAGSGRTAVNVS
ncbi:hypothetical protein HPB50_011472 [Hyalomma asiaticum]|uniref:Uncharacterized protein n=1 Tax=Hyalomma asiaticum TaxID=266040 RepID=A0ACB7TGJ3_HYAAI|nr:hypothetical protein HPB50_011472 [Hyalomma asiaticum]